LGFGAKLIQNRRIRNAKEEHHRQLLGRRRAHHGQVNL
jgi:hypothetical protein